MATDASGKPLTYYSTEMRDVLVLVEEVVRAMSMGGLQKMAVQANLPKISVSIQARR